jgi:hypothetical protein
MGVGSAVRDRALVMEDLCPFAALVGEYLVVDPGLASGGLGCTGSTAEPGSTTKTGEVSPVLRLAWAL